MMKMEANTCIQKNNTPSSLSMHKKSHIIISKPKPKIRIIHIFAPEIIKTDVENFRELVQRLTGKPPMDRDEEDGSNKTKKSSDTVSRRREPRKLGCPSSGSMKKMEMAVRAGLQFRERIRGEDEIWKFANSGGGFLSGFGDHHHQFDGLFMQEICGDDDDQFPLMMECTTAAAAGTTHQVVDVFGEAYFNA